MATKPASAKIRLTASISPSEARSKVLEASRNIFGPCEYSVEESDESVTISSSDVDCLQKIHDQLRDRRVREAARRLLSRGREGNSLSLLLNRQAAARGTVVLCSSSEESPLGPLVLDIESDTPDDLIGWLTAH